MTRACSSRDHTPPSASGASPSARSVLPGDVALADRLQVQAVEHHELTRALGNEVTAHNPSLRAVYGVSPDTAIRSAPWPR